MDSKLRICLVVAPVALLVACGGSSDASIGGTLSGLATGESLVLQDDNTDNLTLSANGGFTFPTMLGAGANYSVSVLTQPVGQTCTVGNGAGSIDVNSDDVSDVTVTCVTSASLTGTVTGLAAGTSVTLANAGLQLPIAANGGFAFPGLLAAGSAYSVTVAVQPAGHSCTVVNGQGTVPASQIAASITVSCS